MTDLERRWSDADRDLVARAMYDSWHASIPFTDQAEDVRAEYAGAAGAVLDALTADGWMRGHCPDCDCPAVPYSGPPPARRLVLNATPPATTEQP
jgi:hypothetical protein